MQKVIFVKFAFSFCFILLCTVWSDRRSPATMPLHILYIMLHPDRCVDHTLAEYLGQVLFADATANFVCINANGLRKRRKRLMLYKMLHDLNVGLCLITETHLRESELSRVRTPGYYRATEHCQDAPLGTWPGGRFSSWRTRISPRNESQRYQS